MFGYCGNNPVKYIDINGDSTAVLNYGKDVGHSALLIQNDEGKWAYYSYNGDKFYSSGGTVGGKDYHDKGEKIFDSPQAFLNDAYNSTGTKEQVNNNEVNNYGFTEAFVLPTSIEQDQAIRESFLKESKGSYNIVTHQCAQVTGKALEAGGVDTSVVTTYATQFGATYNVKSSAGIPSTLFRAIRSNNKGEYIRK